MDWVCQFESRRRILSRVFGRLGPQKTAPDPWLTVLSLSARSRIRCILGFAILLAGVGVVLFCLAVRYVAGLSCAFIASAIVYLYGYHRSATDLSPNAALSHAKNLFVYVLIYFGASWTRILPHKERTIAFISLIVYAALLVSRARRSSKTSDWSGSCLPNVRSCSLPRC